MWHWYWDKCVLTESTKVHTETWDFVLKIQSRNAEHEIKPGKWWMLTDKNMAVQCSVCWLISKHTFHAFSFATFSVKKETNMIWWKNQNNSFSPSVVFNICSFFYSYITAKFQIMNIINVLLSDTFGSNTEARKNGLGIWTYCVVLSWPLWISVIK